MPLTLDLAIDTLNLAGRKATVARKVLSGIVLYCSVLDLDCCHVFIVQYFPVLVLSCVITAFPVAGIV